MASPRTNLFLTNVKGETIIDDFTDSFCHNCILECSGKGVRSTICKLDGIKRKVILYRDELGSLLVCDDKEKTSKNFLSLVELIKHGRLSLIARHNKLKDSILRKVNRDLESFKHNIVHINSDAIHEFYAFIPQDKLFKNYRGLLEIIEDTIKNDPKDAVNLIARLAKYNFNLKTELSVISKLSNSDSKPSFTTGNPRDAVMSSAYMLYPMFKKRVVHINVGEFWDKFDIDYDALQVASFYIIENAVKYSEKNSNVNITFERTPHSLNIIFAMHSFYIGEQEEFLIFNEGFQGEQARKSKRGGKGIGMYRARKLAQFFDGDLIVEPGSYPIEGKDGFLYADNKFIITLPVEMTL